MDVGNWDTTVWTAMPSNTSAFLESPSLDQSFVFPDIPSCREKTKKEQNIQLPHFSWPNWFIPRRGKLHWKTQVRTTDENYRQERWDFRFSWFGIIKRNLVSVWRERAYTVLLNVTCIHLGWQSFFSVTIHQGNSEQEFWFDAFAG